MSRKVVVLGAGHMGTAIVLGLMKKNGVDLHVVDPSESRRAFLKKEYRIDVAASPTSINSEDIVVLAMPPQAFPEFVRGRHLGSGRIGPVISVMAGITLETLSELLGATQVVRSIPNTPSEVFQGMTVFCASAETTAANIEAAEEVLQSFGKTLKVSDERLIDHATALCGGGPAFVAYFASAMQDFAVHAGFSATEAALMVTQVLRGTADLLEATGKPPMQICKEVMTPQGTTERGIFHFDETKLQSIVVSGLQKSSARSQELGQFIHA